MKDFLTNRVCFLSIQSKLCLSFIDYANLLICRCSFAIFLANDHRATRKFYQMTDAKLDSIINPPIVVTTVPAKNNEPNIVHRLIQCWLKPWSAICSIRSMKIFRSSREMLYFSWKRSRATTIALRSSSSFCDSNAWKTTAPKNI